MVRAAELDDELAYAAADVGIASYIFAGPFRAGTTGPRGLDAVLRLVGIG